MPVRLEELTRQASSGLAELADAERARAMAAYMKTTMPFYGVPKPGRQPLLRELVKAFPPADAVEYRQGVSALWDLTHREEKYLAIGYARAFEDLVTFDQLHLYRSMIVEGAWWDFVDEIASHLIGRLVTHERLRMRPVLAEWIDDEDMWLRRTALICQLRHKEKTDTVMLFDFCRRRAHEQEFFVRKAIGWALRELSKVDPRAVKGFLDEMGDSLSGLSRREASRYL